MKPASSPWTIRQACNANWEKMPGDDKRRFCDHCHKHVYNVSAMDVTERGKFASPEGMKECIFYAQRKNGEVADLSLLAKLRKWIPVFRLTCWSALVAILPGMLAGCRGSRMLMGTPVCNPQDVRPISTNAPPSSPQSTNQTSH